MCVTLPQGAKTLSLTHSYSFLSNLEKYKQIVTHQSRNAGKAPPIIQNLIDASNITLGRISIVSPFMHYFS